MAPVDGRAQSLLARQSSATAPGEDSEPMVEHPGKTLNPEHLDLHRRQLDGQRQAIELAADLAKCWSVGIGQRKIAAAFQGAFAEQARRGMA
jgi:hypothetical protein